MRKTKIIATIGPTSCSKEMITRMIESGVDIIRFNMKHNTASWHSKNMELVEEVCHTLKKRVGMLLDLQGPEVRIDKIKNNTLDIKEGEIIRFCSIGNEGIPIDHTEVFTQVSKEQSIYIDDGLLELRIVKTGTDFFDAIVIEGGILKERKTINFPGASFSFPTLIDEDLEHLSLAARHHIDYIALSFVRKVDDIRVLKHEMERSNIDAKVIAKIEHPDAVKNFDEILFESDGIMVARGDLGIEYPLEEVPHLQKMMVKRSREEGRPVIIATQMLESMTMQSRPTRAEVSDVANAVYDSADAIMLSSETASGNDPIRAIQTMGRIATRVDEISTPPEVSTNWKHGGQTVAVVGAANQLMKFSFEGVNDIEAIVILTETGETVQYLSRLRPRLPIIALSENHKTLDQLNLSWGVTPVSHSYSKNEEINVQDLIKQLEKAGYLTHGKKVIMIYGEILGKPGLTSVIRVQQVG